MRAGVGELIPELFGRALRMSRSPAVAEDLVQDAVERALRFEAQYQQGTNLRAWLNQILFSVFITRCRRGRREREALGDLRSDPHAWTTPDALHVPQQLSPPVARALQELPKAFREVVVLVDLEELSYRDAALLLDVPVGTVMSRLHRGRQRLAELLSAGAAVPEDAALRCA